MTRAPEPDAESFVERASVIHPGLAPDLVYLDYNATTPVDPRVVEAMLPYLTTHFGNPSSAHAYAAAPRRTLDAARTLVAELIGAEPAELVFTGSGSEADALAIRGAALAARTSPWAATCHHPGDRASGRVGRLPCPATRAQNGRHHPACRSRRSRRPGSGGCVHP